MIYNIAAIAILLTCVSVQACPYLDSLKKDEEIANMDKSNWSRFLRSVDPEEGTKAETLQGRRKKARLDKGEKEEKKDVCEAYLTLKNLYDEAYPDDSDIYGQASIVGKVVRLVFHDAGEYHRKSPDKLGMDGCLSSGGANVGLFESDGIVGKVIEPMYNEVDDLISKADFITMLGKIAIEKAATAPMKMPFYYGRNDNTECEGGKGRLPGPQNPAGEFDRVYYKALGFTPAEAVTLMGGHTVGHVHHEISGFGLPGYHEDPLVNAFDETPNKFDNNYYYVNIEEPWINYITQHESGMRNEWLVDEPDHSRLVFTNADMYTAFPIDLSGPNYVGKDGQTCDKSYGCTEDNEGKVKKFLPTTAVQVKNYADEKKGNKLFLNDFADVYRKLTTLGYGLPLLNIEGLDAFVAGKMGKLKYVNLEKCQ